MNPVEDARTLKARMTAHICAQYAIRCPTELYDWPHVKRRGALAYGDRRRCARPRRPACRRAPRR
jgi:hypothetical protein